MHDELLSQLTSAAVVMYALQWAKRSRLVPWLTTETVALNRLLAAVGAFVAAIGIHYAFDATHAADGTYVITITNFTAGNVAHGLWHWLNQFCLQQLAYDAVGKTEAAPAPVSLVTLGGPHV